LFINFILIVGIILFFTFYFIELSYFFSFINNLSSCSWLELFKNEESIELLFSLFESFISTVVGFILIFFNSFNWTIYNESGSDDESMDLDESSHKNGYIADTDKSDDSDLEVEHSDNEDLSQNNMSVDNPSNIENFHNRMDALDSLTYHNINENGPLNIRVSIDTDATITLSQEQLNQIRLGTELSVTKDGIDYIITSDEKDKIRCLTTHISNTGETFYKNEANFITDIETSSGEE